MLILTNGLTETADEGFLKVANSLVKRIKKARPDTMVVSYERKTDISDYYLTLNKLLFNKSLISILKKRKDKILYIPFPAKTIATALRIFVLSLFVKGELDVVLVLKNYMNFFARMLVRLSGANLIVLSKDAKNFYCDFLPERRIKYFKTGVDTKKFVPVSLEKSIELKKKYGFDPQKPIILHVGHLKRGRNVRALTKIALKYQVLMIASTLTKDEQEQELLQEFSQAQNIKIINEYLPNIEEIYQMSDVYFFPTYEMCNCIDVPLSCLEAVSCNKPIVTTDYGEMKEFEGKNGFYFINSFDSESINTLIEMALNDDSSNRRAAVLEYDWDNLVNSFFD